MTGTTSFSTQLHHISKWGPATPHNGGENYQQTVQPSRPVRCIHIGYCGPLQIREGKKTGKTTTKSHIAILTRFAINATHPEGEGNLTTAAFMEVLRRFMSWYDICDYICSDNTSKFYWSWMRTAERHKPRLMQNKMLSGLTVIFELPLKKLLSYSVTYCRCSLLVTVLAILRVTVSPELCNKAIASERGFPLRDSPLIASSLSPTWSAPVCSARPPVISTHTLTFLLTHWPKHIVNF